MRQPLSESHPDLAKEADGWNPGESSFLDREKVDWICSKGHRWNAQIASRKAGTGCPVCSGNKILPGTNDMATTHPEIAAEADGWNPREFKAGSDKKQPWICKRGHSYQASIKHRCLRNQGCPYCANKKVLSGFNDLQTLFPEIAAEADGWNPREIIAGSHAALTFKCSLGHRYKSLLLNKTRRSDKCPVCSGKKVEVGFNDLATQFPKIASQADGWDPKTVTMGSGKTVNWICSKGHKWKSTPNSRVSKDSGCPTCANKIVESGFNDLATEFPFIAQEADGWNPKTVVSGSNSSKDWICSKSHKWRATVISRARAGSGCPVCSGLRTEIGFNDLATTHPNLAKEADGWEPTQARFGSEKRLPWICEFGHKWVATPNSRTSSNSNCPICGHQQLLVGFNDLATTHPNVAAEADGWNPSEYITSRNQMKWKCPEGHKWKTTITTRKRGSGCPTCANSGFDPNKDGWLYFLEHPDWEMFQIGITNQPDKRLARHNGLGWQALELRGPMDGHETVQWETAILRMLKAKGADLSNPEIAGKFDGYSEAWSKSTFKVESIKALMKLTEEFENGR